MLALKTLLKALSIWSKQIIIGLLASVILPKLLKIPLASLSLSIDLFNPKSCKSSSSKSSPANHSQAKS